MAGNHLDDHRLLDLAMGQASADGINSGQDHCFECRERLKPLFPLVVGLVPLSEVNQEIHRCRSD